jgi:hypothetical protein
VIIVLVVGDHVVFYLVGIQAFDDANLFRAAGPFAIVVLVGAHVLLGLGHDNETQVLMQATVAHSKQQNKSCPLE